MPAAAPVLVLLGLIVLQPDLGTAIACAGIAACILYVAGMRMRYFAYAFGASLVPLYFLIFHVSFRRDRILAFMNPYAERQKAGFHLIQSLIAVGTGGMTGTGLMEGKQKLFYLPEPHTDFIFAVTAEELGLVGALFVVTLVCDFLVARDAGFVAHGGRFRAIPGGRDYEHGGAAGVHQHQRGAGDDADQGDSAAAGVVWRVVIVCDAGVRGRAAEYYEAGGMRNRHRFSTDLHDLCHRSVFGLIRWKSAIRRTVSFLVYSHFMRAILAGGGTGGHVIPALAIANELKKSYGAEVLFIGTARGIENRLVPAAGYPLQLVRVGALKNVSLMTRAEDGVRFAARGLGCEPHAE